MSHDEPELRLADHPRTDATELIAAQPEAVWALVSDINLPARFSTEFEGAEWLDDAEEPAVGARFVGRSHHKAIGIWETTCTITRCERPRELEWAVMDPHDPTATWGFTLVPEEDGTRLTQWVRLGTAPSGLTPALEAMPDKESRILHVRLGELRANMERNLAGIAAVLAGDQGTDEVAGGQPS